MTGWALVRFLHVAGATFWIGGQVTVSFVLLPIARRTLAAEPLKALIGAVGRRFAKATMAVFLPVQIATGIALAWREGVTWPALTQPGYGRLLALKLSLFAAVMAASAVHGLASSKGRTGLSRGAAMFALVGSLGIVLFATALAG
ncbi:hypothetical protein [Flindersiella endophytica]